MNDTTRELGGTLGVAIVGSVFASLYTTRLADALAGVPVPAFALKLAQQSIGAAFVVAARAPSPQAAHVITAAASDAFMAGYRAGAFAAASVALATGIAAWVLLPGSATGVSTVVDELDANGEFAAGEDDSFRAAERARAGRVS